MTSPSQVADRVDSLLAAWNARDLDGFVAQLAPQVYWHDLGMPHPPAIGRDAVRAFSEAVLRAFPDFQYTLRGAICVAADGLSCVVPFLITATQVKPLTPPGYAPTGRPIRVEGLDYLSFDEHYVTRIETRFDMIDAVEQLLGLSLRPPPGSLREGAAVRLQRLLALWARRKGRVLTAPPPNTTLGVKSNAVRGSTSMMAINLASKLATFADYWQPRTVGQFNGHDLMVVKVKGEFVWHKHENTDDFFLVLKGRITVRMRDGDVTLGPGELFVVPKGAEHCPVADEEAHILLIEPQGTPNTGNAETAAPRRVI